MSPTSTQLPKVSLRKGREWQVAHGHPWLFSGAISQAPKVEPGSLVDLVDTDGRFVARGYYNQACDIAVRILTLVETEAIDESFLKRRLQEALELRRMSIDLGTTDVYRLVNAESDFLPGFIVDNYAGVLVVQSHTAGADRLLEQFLSAIKQTVSGIKTIVVRNDAGVRKREGIPVQPPHVVMGDEPGDLLVRENGIKFAVDPLHGQKTGFFTDQRDKRSVFQRYCRNFGAEATLLNCFSYTGSFSLYACSVQEKWKTVNVDQSQRALDEAKKNFQLNGFDPSAHEFICADAFEWLDAQRADGQLFDVVIVDPPAFAKSHKDKPRALKAYKRMDRVAMEMVRSGGLLVTCSCSGPISWDEFFECLRDAAADAGRRVQVLEMFQNGADHPVSAVAPETSYLKVIFCRVL